MRLIVGIVAIGVLAVAGLFGYSWSRNPYADPGVHASAVGFTLANPLSGRAWRGLACPHRTIVTNLAVQWVGPRLCGFEDDGGARERAERFRTEGPTSCWALFEMLDQQNAERFADVLSGKSAPGAQVTNICDKAKALIAR
jgi:hypothetical protein